MIQNELKQKPFKKLPFIENLYYDQQSKQLIKHTILWVYCGKGAAKEAKKQVDVAKKWNLKRYITYLNLEDEPNYFLWPVKDCNVLIFPVSNVYRAYLSQIARTLFINKAATVAASYEDAVIFFKGLKT